jgi:hypothetical protein
MGVGSSVFPKPERHRRRLQRSTDYSGEIGGEHPKIDLFANP